MKEKLIKIPIFDANLVIFYGDHAEIEEGINNKFEGVNYENTLFQKAQYFSINTGEDIYMCIVLFPESNYEHIYHESLHASYDILDKLGIGVSNDNHEILAFLMGYIAKQTIKTIEEWTQTNTVS